MAQHWDLGLLDLEANDDLIEIGFGHGHALNRAARIVETGRLAGVDFSDVMLQVALRRNRCHIARGRMELELADSARLPFGDDGFDKGFSVHTVYFWSDPAHHLAEAFRVLRPGGRFVLGFHPREDTAAVAAFPSSVYRFPAIDEVQAALERCGFSNLQTTTEQTASTLMAWVVAEKPLSERAVSRKQEREEASPCV